MAIPLGLVALLWSLNANIPRYVIVHYLGERELGIYSALAYLIVAGKMVISALGQSASPRLGRYHSEKKYLLFQKLLLKLLGIGVIFGLIAAIIVIFGGTELLEFIYGKEYANYTDILFWLILGASIEWLATFLDFAMTSLRKLKIQTPLFAIMTLVTLLFSLWLVPLLNLKGAVIALLIAKIFHLISGSLVVAVTISKLRKN